MHFIIAALLVALDQASKYWARAEFGQGGSMPVGLGFSFTYVENTGAAFGMFRGVSFEVFGYTVDGVVLLGLLSLVISVLVAIYLARNVRRTPPLMNAALALILAGAVGNMIDRLLHRFVIDFIHFQWGSFNFPVFNVADSAVVIGAVLLFISGVRSPARDAGTTRVSQER